jgi:hypothetical protein
VTVCDDVPVSPVSRGRKKKNKPAHRPRDVFGQALHDFKSFGSLADPLLAEVSVGDVIEQLPAGRVIEYAESRPSPVSLAFLRALRAVGDSEEAGAAADRLAARGVSEPVWAEIIGQLTLGECWEFADVYGDVVVELVLFERAGVRHALVASVDFNNPARNEVDVAHDPEGLVADLQRRAVDGLYAFRQVSGSRARRLVERCLASPEVEGRMLGLARARVMPEAEPAEELRGYSDSEREAIVSEFVAETGVEDRKTVRLIVDFGCDQDGRPLRIGPGKMVAFLDQVGVEIDRSVLLSWVRWAAAKAALPEEAVREMVAALETVTDPELPLETYLDGLAPGATQEEIVETLARRRFALPEYQLKDLLELLINQLWIDEPAEVWEAAKRLLDAGQDREEILDVLNEVLASHASDDGLDEKAYRAALSKL